MTGQLGEIVELCFFYRVPNDNIQGFQLAVCYDCNLCFIQGTFSVEGTIRHPGKGEAMEYSVVIEVYDDSRKVISRQVMAVGALHHAEKRTVSLRVEVSPDSSAVI